MVERNTSGGEKPTWQTCSIPTITMRPAGMAHLSQTKGSLFTVNRAWVMPYSLSGIYRWLKHGVER